MSVSRGGSASLRLELAASTLAVEPPALRRAGGPRGGPGPLWDERCTESTGESLTGEDPVAQLGAFVVDHDADLRTEPFDQQRALMIGESATRTQVEAELDSCPGAVGVLASRSARCRELLTDRSGRDDEPGSHREGSVGFGHRSRVPSVLRNPEVRDRRTGVVTLRSGTVLSVLTASAYRFLTKRG